MMLLIVYMDIPLKYMLVTRIWGFFKKSLIVRCIKRHHIKMQIKKLRIGKLIKFSN